MATEDILSSPVDYLKGVGPERAALLQKELNIYLLEDLITHFPFRYIDRSRIYTLQDLNETMPFIQTAGRIEKVSVQGQARAKRLTAVLRDATGSLDLIWFKSINILQKIIQPGAEFLVFGKPAVFNGRLNIVHPEMEMLAQDGLPEDKGRLQPVYSTTEKLKARGLDSRNIEKLQRQALERAIPAIKENLPTPILEQFKLMPRPHAYAHIHFPKDMALQQSAEMRLKFEELFIVQVRILRQRNKRRLAIRGHVFEKVGEYLNIFYAEYLPFELTNAQKRVIREIRQDVRTGMQMNRLLQGDVGSGKTVVALMTMLLALDNGKQACLMAPTEILATQHYHTISKLLADMDIGVKLLTGSTKSRERKLIAKELEEGSLHIIIGTHALLEKWVSFPDLGMVVIDEQHRFGVAQRASLWRKNQIPPHILVMTATPIPRTLAMTLYGDLETSIIDELPPGRKEIVTEHRFENSRLRINGFIKKQLAEGRQVYVVYPLIEESETLDYQNLMDGFAILERSFPKPEYQISIVHGKMNAADKEFEMQRFKKKETQILVSTTVIEVGVDVPNATVMVIESAERFGLSQLHQLRGRVGRGGNQSYCILMTGYKLSEDAKLRMETMVRTNNGFEIAEVDLKLRGPGDIAGTRQSGVLNLHIADLVKDQRILVAARSAALGLLDEDPELEKPENAPLKRFLQQKGHNQPNWSLIS